QDRVDDFARAVLQARPLHHFMDQADPPGFGCAEAFAGQGVATHLSDRHRVVELRDDDAGVQAPAGLGDREHGVVGGEHHIACGDDAGAAAEAAALDHGHDRYRQVVEAIDRLGRLARDLEVHGFVLGTNGGDPLEVGARLEVPTVATQQHGAGPGDVREPVEGGEDAVDHGAVVCVVDRGPVQGDGDDATVVDRSEDGGFGHGKSPG